MTVASMPSCSLSVPLNLVAGHLTLVRVVGTTSEFGPMQSQWAIAMKRCKSSGILDGFTNAEFLAKLSTSI